MQVVLLSTSSHFNPEQRTGFNVCVVVVGCVEDLEYS